MGTEGTPKDTSLFRGELPRIETDFGYGSSKRSVLRGPRIFSEIDTAYPVLKVNE